MPPTAKDPAPVPESLLKKRKRQSEYDAKNNAAFAAQKKANKQLRKVRSAMLVRAQSIFDALVHIARKI